MVYFYAQFDIPAQSYGTWNAGQIRENSTEEFDNGEKSGVYFTYKTIRGQKVKLKVGISFVSIGKAKNNLKEIDHWDIELVKQSAEEEWNKIFNLVEIEDKNESNKRMFYTAMYHSFMQPTERTGENPKWNSSEPYFDDFYAIWDTFRATNPLFTLLKPSLERDIIRSLIDIYKFEGYMPDVRSGNDNGRVQGGTDCDILIADALVKKIKILDYETALQSMLKNATVSPGGNERKEGRGGLMDYNKLGYVSTDFERAGSRTMEYSNNDYAIAVIAKMLGKKDVCKKYLEQSQNWENLWNPKNKKFRIFRIYLAEK
jgi:putative alpha-1,2-mannosidase